MTAELVLLPVYIFSILAGAFLTVAAFWALFGSGRHVPPAVPVRNPRREF